MPKMMIKGLGLITVTKLPRRIPKHMTDPVTGRRIRMDRHIFRVIWANNHITEKERKRLFEKWRMRY